MQVYTCNVKVLVATNFFFVYIFLYLFMFYSHKNPTFSKCIKKSINIALGQLFFPRRYNFAAFLQNVIIKASLIFLLNI